MASPSQNDEDETFPHASEHRTPVSEEEALEILDEIRDEKGYLNDENIADMAHVAPRTRRKYHKMAINYRKEQAKSTMKTAEDLYSTKFRLIYELLQNADDAQHQRNTDPWVNFSIYPHKLVVDTNEAGFTIADVRAICRTGESSKSASPDGKPIGEKGYGFKSVFAISNLVKIQSGHWSFCFKHDEGQDGMGMITPLDSPRADLPDGTTTRITLRFRPGHDDIFAQLVDEMNALPDTVTIFLQQINWIRFTIHYASGSKSSTTIKAALVATYSESSKHVMTKKTTSFDEGADNITADDEDHRHYIIFKKQVSGMPTEKRRNGIEATTVQLAFPIYADHFQPRLDPQGQYIFAFLPMQRMAQIPFTVQADFITLASRESVVDCKWNRKLLEGIVQTFTLAVETFYDDENLRYVWMKYMPGSHIDGFWHPLREKIENDLASKKILETWIGSSALISQLRIVPRRFLYNKSPLFDDLEDELYLSPNYEGKELDTLRDLGVTPMTLRDFSRRLEYDLSQTTSRFYNKNSECMWHEKVSAALIQILDNPKLEILQKKIRNLKLIPIREELEVDEDLEDFERGNDCTWISATTMKGYNIYFPGSQVSLSPGDILDGMDTIPIPLGLTDDKVVWPAAAKGPQRKVLLAKLGVEDADPCAIIDEIQQFHEICRDQEFSPSLKTIIPQLRYLFRFWDYDDPSFFLLFHLATDGLSRTEVNNHPIYFKSESQYSAWELLKGTSKEIRNSYAKFVHDEIFAAEPEHVVSRGSSWHDWLRINFQIKTVPLLRDSDTETQLSPILRYVVEHRPVDFLPLLKTHWNSGYNNEAIETPEIEATIAGTEVLCENGRLYELSETYLPLENLKDEATRIGVAQELPILNLSSDLTSKTKKEWDFLLEFGVRSQIDLDFYTGALDIIADFEYDHEATLSLVSKIYSSIGSMCNLEMQNDLKEAFLSHFRIYTDNGWKNPDDCVWEAPKVLLIRDSLSELYSNIPAARTLFCTHLGLRNANYRDYLDQLTCWKEDENAALMLSDCAAVYCELLKDENLTESDWDEIRQVSPIFQVSRRLLRRIRQTFEAEKLVLVKGQWCAPSKCLWSSGITMSDKMTIAEIYDEFGLEALFIGHLNMQVVHTAMVIDELNKRANARNGLTVEEAKAIVLEIARMMETEIISDRSCFQRLRRAKFLPVSVGSTKPTLEDNSAEFVIADHERYSLAFKPLAAFLDFSLEEVQVLQPLIEALGLENRYLSQNVKEVSEVSVNPDRNNELTSELRSRAYAFYCCAVKYKSAKVTGHDQSLYKRLSNIQVSQTDAIRTSMILVQNGKPIAASSKRVQLKCEDITDVQTLGQKIDRRDGTGDGVRESGPNSLDADSEGDSQNAEQDSDYTTLQAKKTIATLSRANKCEATHGIRISVPADPLERKACYRSQLPGALLIVLGIKETQALLPINRLLNLQSEGSSEASILEDHDIPVVSWITPPATFFQTGVHPVDLVPLDVKKGGFSASPKDRIILEDNEAHQNQNFRSESKESYVKRYTQLLGHIIQQVKRNHRSSSTGTSVHWNVNNWIDDLPEVKVPSLFSKDEIFGVRNEDHLAHDKRIGAAGELFVFETLCSADLEDFGYQNWESSIRHLVQVHPHYAKLERKTRTERADIVYQDIDGQFLQWLHQQNPLGMLDWLSEPTTVPRTYFIEVKTTVKGPKEPFHLSKPQYERMFEMRKRSHEMSEEVYVIFRVYNLLSDKIDMDIYVDPWRSKKSADHVLRFEVRSYLVHPT